MPLEHFTAHPPVSLDVAGRKLRLRWLTQSLMSAGSSSVAIANSLAARA